MPANGTVGTVDARVREWRAVNDAATAGPRRIERQGFQWWIYAKAQRVAAAWLGEKDARHIATFSPDVVGRLLDCVEALAMYEHVDCTCTACVHRDAALAQLAAAVGGTHEG